MDPEILFSVESRKNEPVLGFTGASVDLAGRSAEWAPEAGSP